MDIQSVLTAHCNTMQTIWYLCSFAARETIRQNKFPFKYLCSKTQTGRDTICAETLIHCSWNVGKLPCVSTYLPIQQDCNRNGIVYWKVILAVQSSKEQGRPGILASAVFNLRFSYIPHSGREWGDAFQQYPQRVLRLLQAQKR